MDCSDFRSQLDEYLDGRLVAGHEACVRHLEGCPDCRSRVASERRLREALRQLPTPMPRGSFEDRVLRTAMRAAPSPRRGAWVRYAAAAALLLAVAGGILSLRMPPQAEATLATVPAGGHAEPRTVRLVLTAPRALPGAQIRLELPDHSEFAAYKGQRVLEWTADLVEGPNLLEVTIHGPGKGVALATVSYRGSQRTLPLPLESTAQTRTRNEPELSSEYQHA
ncbi:anti-sigma factor family protein [Solimonas fluminis]|uniref:anti-sigma factor family protein n=1 Tax=Solimonas fluminis TaxID=2086571 RepID=UPI0013FD525A|nr:zf-HC2 domain-containing protein [Solimonas fluminis]